MLTVKLLEHCEKCLIEFFPFRIRNEKFMLCYYKHNQALETEHYATQVWLSSQGISML